MPLMVTAHAQRADARIIGVMRLAKKKENGKLAVLLVKFGANRAFVPKCEQRFKWLAVILRHISAMVPYPEVTIRKRFSTCTKQNFPAYCHLLEIQCQEQWTNQKPR